MGNNMRTAALRIIYVIFTSLALSFIVAPVPSSGQDLPSSQGEATLVLWQATKDSQFPPAGRYDADNGDTTRADSFGSIQTASLQTESPESPQASPFPSPAGAVTILWQAAKAEGSSDAASDRTVESKDTAAEDTFSDETVPDPLEPINRVFFEFNDKFYFWALKPVASAYKAVLPEELRVSIKNFFSNVTTPVRFANCLLQGEFKGAGNEAARFGINTTFGFLGMIDQAKDKFQIEKENRDFGQTLGTWGLQPLLYIEWPILGPSNVRDTAGFVGDILLDPRTYFLDRTASIITWSTEIVNNTSLLIGEYESLKKAALDPYIAKRDAYHDYRQNKIKNRK